MTAKGWAFQILLINENFRSFIWQLFYPTTFIKLLPIGCVEEMCQKHKRKKYKKKIKNNHY